MTNDKIKDAQLYLNNFYFGPLVTEPSTFDDDWHAVISPHIVERRSRAGLEDLSFENGIFRATHVFTREVPNEQAVAELQAVVDAWTARGRRDFANLIIARDESDEYDSWTDNIIDDLTDTETVREPVEIRDPIFLKYMTSPINPKGLSSLFAPFKNARITGLSTEGLTDEL